MNKPATDTVVVEFKGTKNHYASHDGVDFGGPNGPGGGGGDVLERVARLESDVAHIQRDVTDIKQKLDRVADDVGDLKVSMASLSGRQALFESKLNTVESKLDAMDKKFDGLDKRFATKEELHTALHAQTKWLILSMLAIVSGAVGVLKFFG